MQTSCSLTEPTHQAEMVSTIPEEDPLTRTTRLRAVLARTALTVALVIVTGWARSAVPATISIVAEVHGDGIRIHAHALLRTDAGSAWRVLTDYDHYAEFIPDLRSSRVVVRTGAIVVVEQSAEARMWLFRLPLDIEFEVAESPPYGMHSRAPAGGRSVLESRYPLTPAPGGVHLDYFGDVAPGSDRFGLVEQYAVRLNVARQFQALADEVERRNALPR
jgi:hypothetical protein